VAIVKKFVSSFLWRELPPPTKQKSHTISSNCQNIGKKVKALLWKTIRMRKPIGIKMQKPATILCCILYGVAVVIPI
jgi:hypothetical protein